MLVKSIFRVSLLLMACLLLAEVISASQEDHGFCTPLSHLANLEPGNIAQIDEIAEWDSVIDVAFVDDRVIGILFSTGRVEFIDLTTCQVQFTDLAGDVTLGAGNIYFNSDGSRLLYRLESGASSVWDTHCGELMFVSDDPLSRSVFPADLRVGAMVNDHTITILDVDTHRVLAQTEFSQNVEQLIFFHNADKLALIDQSLSIHIWDYAENRLLSQAIDDEGVFTDIEISPADDVIAVSRHRLTQTADGYVTSVLLLDPGDVRTTAEISVDGIYYGARFDLSGRILILNGTDNYLRESQYFWDINRQERMALLTGRTSGGGNSALNAPAQLLAIGSGTSYGVPILSFPDLEQLVLLDTPGGTTKQVFNRDNTLLLTLTFSPIEATTTAKLWGIASH